MVLPILGLTREVWVLDIESYSDVDLKKRGQYIYWADPSSRVLMASARQMGVPGPTYLWDFEAREDQYPRWFLEKLQAPAQDIMIAAANCEFDRQGLTVQGYPTPDKKWLDILVLAYFLGFAGRLDAVLQQIFPDTRKDSKGTRLITLFSTPPHAAWHEHPEKWEQFRHYCEHDTEVEARLLEWCLQFLNQPWFQPIVRKLYKQELIYRRINRRGIPVDRLAVRGARAIRDTAIGGLMEELRTRTGLSNPNSRNQLLAWLQSRGYPHQDLTKASVQAVLRAPETPQEILDVLQLRMEIGKSSTKKYDALDNISSDVDNRLRGGWQYYGASRTGRGAGRVPNPGNITRPATNDPDRVAEWMQFGNLELLTLLFPEKEIMETLSSSIRASLAAPDGQRWCVADLTSIESIGASWLTGCHTILDIFHTGRDVYRTFATRLLNKPYDEVTDAERTFVKPCVLGGAYGLSPFGLTRYAQGMGVDIDLPTAEAQIKAFRDEYHEITHYWRRLTAASIQAVKNPGCIYRVSAVAGIDQEWTEGDRVCRTYYYAKWPQVSFRYDGKTFLYCQLPSGRFLCYFKPRIDPNFEIKMPDGHSFTTESLLYWGVDQDMPGHFWQEISTYGAKLLANITQAFCRDILWHGLEQAEDDSRLEVVGEVCDEIMSLCQVNDRTALDRLKGYMTSKPHWLTDSFFLDATGYISKRYKRG